jgi:hypothetical protein
MIKLFQDGKHVRTIPLQKIKEDLYVIDAVSFDERSFKVGFSGTDPEEQNFERVISTVLNPGKGKMRFCYYLL